MAQAPHPKTTAPLPVGRGACAGPCLISLVLLALANAATLAQPGPSPPDPEEPTKLPVFEVRDTHVGAYGAREATSTTRVSIPIHDLAQSVSVVTRELIDDTQGLRMIDVARFVTPVMENHTGAGDWYSIRGFFTAQRFIDGVQVGAQGNSMYSDLSNVERIEIVKGPNAVLVPGSGFGGRMNQITKSPKFEHFTRLSFSARSYLGNEASLDANRVFHDSKTAARLVMTRWDGNGYFQSQFRRGWLFAPSFAHRFPSGAELILKVETLENHESTAMGVAIDPAVGTRIGGYARRHPLLPRDNQWPPDTEQRTRRETRLTSELRWPVAERVAARLWVMADYVSYVTPNASARPVEGARGGRHPLTGEWEPFKAFGYDDLTKSVTVLDVPPSASTWFNRFGQVQEHHFEELHVKNDYAVEHEFGSAGSGTTIGGLSANWQFRVDSRVWGTSGPSLNYAAGRPVDPPGTIVMGLPTDKEAEEKDVQAFVYQRFNLFDDRLIFSGGVAAFHGVLERLDDSGRPPVQQRVTRNSVIDWNLGAIVKPRPEVSFFAGYNRVGGALPLSTAAGDFASKSFKVGFGAQREIGVKTSWLKHRLTTSAAYFDLSESNARVNNPAWNHDSPPEVPQFLYLAMANHGWEVECKALITPSFELVGNFTHMHMRDSNGVPQRMVPDNAGAFFAEYTILQGRCNGLGISCGVDYVGAVPGETAALFTDADVPNQPSFYLAPRTILQAGISYRRDRWSFAVVVKNLANKDYIQSSIDRDILLPGEPRNYSATLELRW